MADKQLPVDCSSVIKLHHQQLRTRSKQANSLQLAPVEVKECVFLAAEEAKGCSIGQILLPLTHDQRPLINHEQPTAMSALVLALTLVVGVAVGKEGSCGNLAHQIIMLGR